VAVTPDGSTVYLTNTISNNVSVITPATNQVTTITDSSFNSPDGVAVTPDGGKVYVVNHSSTGTVSVIATASNQVTTIEDSSLIDSIGVAVSPDGTNAYVASGSGFVTEIATAKNQVKKIFNVGASAAFVAVTPGGSKVYFSSFPSPAVGVIPPGPTKFICKPVNRQIPP
jgi:YVTN family beta-propeller protein